MRKIVRLNREAVIRKFNRPTKFWNETEEFYCLDSRQVDDTRLLSGKIFISKLDSTIKKYSDSVCLFSPDKIADYIKKVHPNVKVKFIFDSFSDTEFNELHSLMPVMIFQKI